jgi:hypothetical protein
MGLTKARGEVERIVAELKDARKDLVETEDQGKRAGLWPRHTACFVALNDIVERYGVEPLEGIAVPSPENTFEALAVLGRAIAEAELAGAEGRPRVVTSAALEQNCDQVRRKLDVIAAGEETAAEVSMLWARLQDVVRDVAWNGRAAYAE